MARLTALETNQDLLLWTVLFDVAGIPAIVTHEIGGLGAVTRKMTRLPTTETCTVILLGFIEISAM